MSLSRMMKIQARFRCYHIQGRDNSPNRTELNGTESSRTEQDRVVPNRVVPNRTLPNRAVAGEVKIPKGAHIAQNRGTVHTPGARRPRPRPAPSAPRRISRSGSVYSLRGARTRCDRSRHHPRFLRARAFAPFLSGEEILRKKKNTESKKN